MKTIIFRADQSQKTHPGLHIIAGVLSVALGAFIIILGYFTRRKNEETSIIQPSQSPQSTDGSQVKEAQVERMPIATLWKPTTKYIMSIILFVFVLVVIYLARSVIPLVIIGSLIAFVVQPVVVFFQTRLRMKRGLAISLTYFLALLIILLLPLVLIPSVVNVIGLVSGIDFQKLLQDFAVKLTDFSTGIAQIPLMGSALEQLLRPLIESLENVSKNQPVGQLNLDIAYDELVSRLASTLGVLVRAVGALASAGVAIFFSLFISVYLSFDAHKMRSIIPNMLPPAYKDEIEALFGRLGAIWEGFVRGQIILMIIVGFAVWLGASVLGLPQPIFFGFLSGMLEMIPSLGPLLAFIPAVSVALIFGSTHFALNHFTFGLIVAIFYLLVQFFENQFIVPRVLGHAVDLHPLVVLIGALAAGSQFGVLGIFLAAPAIASFREISRYIYTKILEHPPEPPREKSYS